MTEFKNYTQGQPIELVEDTKVFVHKDVLKYLELYQEIGTIPQLRALKEDRDKCFLELQQYRAIGTVEEFKVLKEKNEPKKPAQEGCYDSKGVWHTWNGINGVPYDLCPNCDANLCTDGMFGRNKKTMNYCERFGQKLDWE